MSRKSRDSKIPPQQLLTPFDVSKFGSEEDPCFGKLYSLMEEECQLCGDNEVCAIVFANRAHAKRIEQEKKTPILDLTIDKLEKDKDIKEYIAKLKKKGFKKSLIKYRVKKRFRVNMDVIK